MENIDTTPRPAPAIFLRGSGRRPHPIGAVSQIRSSDREARIRATTLGGPDVYISVTFSAPDVVRYRWSTDPDTGVPFTEMLVEEPARLPVQIQTTEERIAIDAGGPTLICERDPWRLSFGTYSSEPFDVTFFASAHPAGGVATDDDGTTQSYETFALSAGEQLWGSGERFLGPGLRGQRLHHWISEPFGSNTTDDVYKSVPLLLSSRGYGLFFHHPQRGVLDCGSASTASAVAMFESSGLDMFIFLGDPKHVLRRYTELTGRPPVPPEWSFQPWVSRCMYRSRAEVEGVVETARRLGVDVGVVNLDPLWMSHRGGQPNDVCDFVWDEKAFGPMSDLASWLHERDVRLCLWVNPYVDESSGAFVGERLVDGGRARTPEATNRACVDLTGAGADWWTEQLQTLMRSGADAFKLDYAESLPVDCTMADGRSGADVHNLYPLLASKVAAQAGVPVSFTRAGTAGSQRYPLHWAGDSQSTWAGFHGSLRGGLSAAWSGFAHWTTDIGGFYRRGPAPRQVEQPPLEIYMRWMAFGMLSSHTRYHGVGPREPWAFGEAAVDTSRRYSHLRRRLRGYLLDCAREAAKTGTPIMRPLAMEHPDDLGARHVDTGYHLGPDLLVFPVLEPGGSADVYLPPGAWTDHYTGRTLEGPRWERRSEVPLNEVPLYARTGTDPFGPA